MMARPAPTTCRYEPCYPEHETVCFCDHGGSELVAHYATDRCPIECPHLMSECGEFIMTLEEKAVELANELFIEPTELQIQPILVTLKALRKEVYQEAIDIVVPYCVDWAVTEFRKRAEE